MSPRFPAVTARQVSVALRKCGFQLARQAGTSHAMWRRESDGRRVNIPVHAGKILKRKTLAQILDDAGLTVDEFNLLLGRINR